MAHIAGDGCKHKCPKKRLVPALHEFPGKKIEKRYSKRNYKRIKEL